MATVITSECINCGACESECPNTAIYQGGVQWELNGAMHEAISNDIFYIVPEKCTECVGFYDHEACAAVCPVDCCVPDPERPESEEILIARAHELHPGEAFPEDFPSRFKQEGTGTPSSDGGGAKAEDSAPTPAAAAAAPAAPVAAAAPAAALPTTAIPEVGEWEVPIQCHRCQGAYSVPFRHFRSGVVFYCPFCSNSYVVQTAMHNHVARQLREFHAKWQAEFDAFQEKRQRQLDDFEESQRAELEAFNESLKRASYEFKPPGAPRKRAWIFG
jgi:ferredoxin